MRFISESGRERVVKHPKKYLINWKAKSLSKFQKSVKDFLFPYWGEDVVFEEFPMVGTRMKFDFYNASKKIIIEVSGEQHLKYNKFMHGGNKLNFLEQLKRDNRKQKFCNINNITFVEIFPKDKVDKAFFEQYEIYL